MKVLIFAAGLGTRLKPLTDTLPKALVPVCGKPLLEHLILKLKAAGFSDLVINVHHFSGKIIDFLEEKEHFGIKIQISDESSDLLETGGGMKYATPLLSDGSPFLVHNVDILSNVDLRVFYNSHEKDSLATLLVSERSSSRYLLFDTDNCLVGWTNINTGEVKTPYPDLKIADCRKYAFSGIHVASPAVFGQMEGWSGAFSVIDFYLSLAKEQQIKAHVEEHLQLLDVGKAKTLELAEKFIAEERTKTL